MEVEGKMAIGGVGFFCWFFFLRTEVALELV